jgi:hypothetical protein
MYALIWQASGDRGLTWEQIVRDIPHDGGAVLAYLLLGFFVFLIWYGSRPDVIEHRRSRQRAHDMGAESTADAVEPTGSIVADVEAVGPAQPELVAAPFVVRIAATGAEPAHAADHAEPAGRV